MSSGIYEAFAPDKQDSLNKAKPKKPRKLNIVATHYVVRDGKLKAYDVIRAPLSYRTTYKYREQGAKEGAWSPLSEHNLVTSKAKAKAEGLKKAKSSLKMYKKWYDKQKKVLAAVKKLKVK